MSRALKWAALLVALLVRSRAYGQHTVNLAWSESSPVDPAVSFNIYRAPFGTTSWVKINSGTVSSTSYADTTVVNGTVYIYQVTAVDSNGAESLPSNVTTASIPSGNAQASKALAVALVM